MNNYIDQYGRIHISPVTEADPLPTNNAYIYSFYAKMVGLPVTFTEPVISELVNIDTKVMSRHPGIIPPAGVPISYDEYVGIAGVDQMSASEIVHFGEDNYFQFCDIPDFKSIPFRKLPINDVISAYEDLAHEENPRTAVIKYPTIYPIAFWHRPNVQYFYYRCANRTPGAYRTIFHFIANLVSIAQNDPKDVMSGFQFLKYKELGLSFSEKILYYIYKKKVDFKQNCRNSFPEDHPILGRVLNVK